MASRARLPPRPASLLLPGQASGHTGCERPPRAGRVAAVRPSLPPVIAGASCQRRRVPGRHGISASVADVARAGLLAGHSDLPRQGLAGPAVPLPQHPPPRLPPAARRGDAGGPSYDQEPHLPLPPEPVRPLFRAHRQQCLIVHRGRGPRERASVARCRSAALGPRTRAWRPVCWPVAPPAAGAVLFSRSQLVARGDQEARGPGDVREPCRPSCLSMDRDARPVNAPRLPAGYRRRPRAR